MRFGLKGILPVPALAWVMILVLLNQAMALGHDYRALTLDDCLALAREQNPVLTASREKVQELVVAKANSQSLQLLEKKRDRLNGIKVDLPPPGRTRKTPAREWPPPGKP